MRTVSVLAALAAACAATPAHATLGQLCRPVSGDGPSISIVIPTGIGWGIAGASLMEGESSRSTMVEGSGLAMAQSWIDRERLWIDLVDAESREIEARLRVAVVRTARHWHYAGTLERGGRVYRVRCEES